MKQTTFIQRAATALLTIALTATTAWAQTTETVSYIDADGTQKSVTATVLTGDITQSGFELNDYGKPLMPAGWYVVKNSNADGVDASCTKEIKATGDQGTIHIILADGAEMTVNGGGSYGFDLDTGYPLAIYGQSAGTGRLTVSSSSWSRAILSNSGVTINGGIVSATSSDGVAIYSSSVTINGGQVTATGGENQEGIHGTTTLGCRKLTDFIKSNGFYGSVTIKSGQSLYDGNTAYSGTLSTAQRSALANSTLRPFSSDDLAVNDDNTEYTIHTATGWGLFCDMLAQSDKGVFSGKTVLLGNDIEVSRMAGSDSHDFCGTFDGQGKTLTVSYSGSSYVAPFSYVDGATIQNLVVEGTISSSGTRAAGVIGETGSPGTTGKSYITNCVSSSTITGGNYSGGFSIGGNVEIEGCVFNGIINSDGNSGGFVGYSQSALTITNSLFAPQSGSSAKGTFYYNGTAGTLTNCYYTQTLGEGQGKQAHSIAAGEGVTLGHAGAATEYSVSGITAYKASGASADSDPFIDGIIYNNVLYAGSGDAVSLTLTNSAGDAPLGYKNSGDYSATGGATLSGSTLTMADDNVSVSFTPGALRSTHQAVLVSYIDAEGQPASHDAIALDGTETTLGQNNQETWYFVGADISYCGTINCYGNVNIILADGYTMTVNNNDGIDGAGGSNDILTIYGQTFGTGTLDITATNYGIDYGSVVIRGGTVNATGTNQDGINAYGNVTITGGQITATSNRDGIYSIEGNITLGCTNASDFIKATSYFVGDGKSVNIADGQTLYDEDGNPYSGNSFVYYDLAGKTLRLSPGIDLAARQAPDGNYWTTYYNGTTGFTIDENEHACAYTATYGAGQLTLHKLGKEIPAGTAVIIVADNDVVSMTTTVLPAFTGDNDLLGVDVDTPVADIRSDLGDGTFYVLGQTTVDNQPHFGFHRYTGTDLPARKAYVLVSGSSPNQARALTLVFGGATGITNTDFTDSTDSDAWYSINGVKLSQKPTKAGLYIYKGKKLIVK